MFPKSFRSLSSLGAVAILVANVWPSTALAAATGASLTVELGAAWQQRNTAQVPNRPPNTRFRIDELTGSGPFAAGRVVLDWHLSGRHRLRFLVAPLGLDETGVAADPGPVAAIEFPQVIHIAFIGRWWIQVGIIVGIKT